MNDPIAIRRRIIELRTLSGALQGDRLLAELDAFLTTTLRGEHQTSDVLWAARQRVEMYLDRGVRRRRRRFSIPRAGDPATAPEADRNLYEFLRPGPSISRSTRRSRADAPRPARPDDGPRRRRRGVGWLLGRIMQLHASPEVALSLLDRVCATHFTGPFVVASKFGRAEVLWQLQRHAESQAAYADTIEMLPSVQNARIVDARMVCASATQAWDWSLSHGDDENALRYLRIAMSLLPPDDAAQQAVYVERLADLWRTWPSRISMRASSWCRHRRSRRRPTECTNAHAAAGSSGRSV